MTPPSSTPPMAFTGRHAAVRSILFAICLSFAASCAPAVSTAAPMKPGKLDPPTWSEEFNGDELDRTIWDYRATGDRHDGVITEQAVSVHDGALKIKSYTEDGKHYSGMIATTGTEGFEQKYGYYEARMKFNDAPGEWSAFWLQSRSIGSPKGDPTTAGVEMDVVEHRQRCRNASRSPSRFACDPDLDVNDHVQQGLIWDGYGTDHQSLVRFSDALDGLVDDTWHTFALSWTPTGLTFYYDDAVTWSVSGPISQHKQYIILSSEIGADFAGPIPDDGYGSRDTSVTNLQVDYVRVWDLLSKVPVPVNLRSPAAAGAEQSGAALTCSSGSWTGDPPPAFKYEWLSDGAPTPSATSTSATR
jgi:beta-glucanase (GH16 family)